MSDITSSEKPGGGSPISKDQAKKMIQEYEEKRLKLIKDTYGIDDTKSVWFSREVFEEMLKAHPKTDGIRIYFGVNYEGVLKGHQNVVLVGTKNEAAEGEKELHAQDDDENIFDFGTTCPPDCNGGESMGV